MAKMIYGLKIFLFRDEFYLTDSELAGLRQFDVFVIRIYLKAWYTCQIPASAPRLDLQLLNDLNAYKTINSLVASVAIESLLNHLWYLSEPMVGLAFFDPEIPEDQLKKMALALEKEGSPNCPVRVNLSEQQVLQMQLHDFVTSNTKKLFAALNMNTVFLQQHPHTWKANTDYTQALRQVAALKVVNDPAERGVALMQTFNSSLSNQEEQKQFILQVVERHRKEFPNSKKATLTQKVTTRDM
jgi:hypothetical protein